MTTQGKSKRPGIVLVTGATGYIGGRLVPRLLDAGWRVRCMARSPRKLEGRPWGGRAGLEVVAGDAEKPEEVAAALRGCSAAYYLVHSMMAVGETYREHDRRLARTFAEAAAREGVERIVYLGGLGRPGRGSPSTSPRAARSRTCCARPACRSRCCAQR